MAAWIRRIWAGDWIYFISDATNQLGGNVSVTNIASFMAYEKARASSMSSSKPAPVPPFQWRRRFTPVHRQPRHPGPRYGLQIFGYTRSCSASQGEIDLAACFSPVRMASSRRRAEWEATNRGSAHKDRRSAAAWPESRPFGPPNFSRIPPCRSSASIPRFPKEFGFYCDTVMPQIYHFSFEMTPSATDWSDTEE
jgi:hypothetical protein